MGVKNTFFGGPRGVTRRVWCFHRRGRKCNHSESRTTNYQNQLTESSSTSVFFDLVCLFVLFWVNDFMTKPPLNYNLNIEGGEFFVYRDTLPETHIAEHRPGPTLHFQLRTLSFRKGVTFEKDLNQQPYQVNPPSEPM